jgi:hypothetical protein
MRNRSTMCAVALHRALATPSVARSGFWVIQTSRANGPDLSEASPEQLDQARGQPPLTPEYQNLGRDQSRPGGRAAPQRPSTFCVHSGHAGDDEHLLPAEFIVMPDVTGPHQSQRRYVPADLYRPAVAGGTLSPLRAIRSAVGR